MATRIETERLIVRPFRPDDWPDMLAYLSLPEIYRFEPGEPIDEAQARILAEDRARGSQFWAVELAAERRMVGHLSLFEGRPADLRTWEIGYIVNPRDQGHGYATEAARGLVGHVFGGLGAHRVIAQCHPDNVASWRVLEKAGFVREGRLQQNIFFRHDDAGRPIWQDTLVYGRLADTDEG